MRWIIIGKTMRMIVIVSALDHPPSSFNSVDLERLTLDILFLPFRITSGAMKLMSRQRST